MSRKPRLPRPGRVFGFSVRSRPPSQGEHGDVREIFRTTECSRRRARARREASAPIRKGATLRQLVRMARGLFVVPVMDDALHMVEDSPAAGGNVLEEFPGCVKRHEARGRRRGTGARVAEVEGVLVIGEFPADAAERAEDGRAGGPLPPPTSMRMTHAPKWLPLRGDGGGGEAGQVVVAPSKMRARAGKARRICSKL